MATDNETGITPEALQATLAGLGATAKALRDELDDLRAVLSEQADGAVKLLEATRTAMVHIGEISDQHIADPAARAILALIGELYQDQWPALMASQQPKAKAIADACAVLTPADETEETQPDG